MDIDATLKKHGLRKTAFRQELLRLFVATPSSLTVQEVKSKVKLTDDKVTIYRALKSFEDHGLIHQVPDKLNVIRFALCKTECSMVNHIHNHLHFICNWCKTTYCLHEFEIPKIELPKNFSIESVQLLVEGRCAECN